MPVSVKGLDLRLRLSVATMITKSQRAYGTRNYVVKKVFVIMVLSSRVRHGPAAICAIHAGNAIL